MKSTMKKITGALLIAGLFGSVASAQASTISYTGSVPLTQTDWGPTAVSFAKFDTNLGTLTSILFDLTGTVSGIGNAENLASAANVTLTLGSTITLTRPDLSVLVVANPLFTTLFNFTAFDGGFDFAGSSGGSTGVQTNTNSASFTSISAGDLALFSSAIPGFINLNLKALGASSAVGSGNLITQFSTQASGLGKVTYNYTANAVPEPASLGIMGLGLGVLGLTRRRRSVKAA